MAEIQWVIEVRCVNTLLAEFKVCERGQHLSVHVPDRCLDPHEFGKMIEGAEEAKRLADAHRGAGMKQPAPLPPLETEMGTVGEIVRRNDIYDIQILEAGEIVSMNVGGILGPSEFDRFIAEMKMIQGRLAAS
ncbi:MAG: hypothetical protein JXB47_10540 [Anaerolineae bacterium]|nr:hypothetical protein [Anaerolineae bacterium]